MKKKYLITIIVIACLVLFGGGYLITKKYLSHDRLRQAVFLTNGQVYFGYIEDVNDQMVKISDIYYLKSDQIAQDEKDKKVSLIKMGSELHGPFGYINVNRDQILFYEDLKPDSKINVAIDKSSAEETKKSQ